MELASVLRNHRLRYSVHGISRLNLAYDPRHDLAKRIMRCQIEISKAVGASRLVHHSGLQALDAARLGLRQSLLSDEELTEGASREVEALRELAPIASDAGIVIGLENGDPHLWEYEVLANHGLPPSELFKHHRRLLVRPILRQLEAVDHPAVGMTLDIGHLHIAASQLGEDLLQEVEEAAPWVVHLHVNDNFGTLDQGVELERDRLPYGEADLHLPPGWGAIPFARVFQALEGYRGDIVLEIKPWMKDSFGEALQNTREILNRLEAGS